jgi:hypothetical protein
MARRRSPARLVVALSVAAVLAVFLLYTSIAGGGTPSIAPSELGGRTDTVALAGLVVGPVTGDDIVSLSFPIAERTEMVDIEKQNYFFTLKGADVVDVYPRGQFCPLYQRNHYRQSATRWKKVARFVSDESIYW